MACSRRIRAVAVLGWVLAGTAWAGVPDPVPVGPDDWPDSVRSGWVWRETGPPQATNAMADVAVLGATAVGELAIVAVIDRDGAVWVSRDATHSWRLVLPPLKAADEEGHDDDLLFDVEDRVREEVQDQGDTTSPDELELPDNPLLPDAETPDLEPQVPDASEVVQDAIDAASEGRTRPREALPPRIWLTADGVLLVGRQDGLQGSTDFGRTWRQLLDVQPTALIRVPSGSWLLGTTDGFRLSDDPLRWDIAEASLQGVLITDVAVDEAGVHAGSDEGLWHSKDGRRWLGEGVIDGAVYGVLADPDTDHVWLATDDGVMTAAEHGRRPLPQQGTPKGVRSMAWLGPDHVIVAGSEGPFETIDGGRTWTSLAGRLPRPETSEIVVVEGVLWLAGASGLFRLEPDDGSLAAPTRVEGWLGVDVLMNAALARNGIAYVPSGNRVIAGLLPQLRLVGEWHPSGVLGYNNPFSVADFDNVGPEEQPTFLESGTRGTERGEWQLQAQFIWTPQRSRRGAALDPLIAEDRVFELGGEVMVDEGDDALLGDRLNRLGADYSLDVARTVSDLYHSRQGLVAEAPSYRSRPLLEQTMHELRIAEAEARLDALTDGAVTSWRLTTSEEKTP